MRKLLLVGAAILATTGLAQAQTQLVTTPVPPGTSGPFANAQPGVGPGQVAVRLNGRFSWYFGVSGNGDIHTATEKLTTTGMKSFIRLYPGFDGMAANGLRYGVAAEIRQDNEAQATAGPSGIAQNGARGRLYWRRASGYIGGDSWGRIQVGSNDGPVTAMGGIGQWGNIGTGNICGDAPGFNHTGAGPWPFYSCSGNWYTTQKIVYYSPQWAGFDIGIMWEPSTAGLQSGQDCSGAAAAAGNNSIGNGGCDMQSGTATNLFNRRRNTFDAAIRYRGTFGGVGIAAVGGYINSGHVDQNGAITGAAATQPVRGMSVGYGGATVSFAGFSIGGSVQGGAANNSALRNVGGRDQLAWIFGGTYTMGPVQFGASYFETYRQGNWSPVSPVGASRKRTDRGFEAAINYGIAPGLSAVLEYIWTDSKQRNIDLVAVRGGVQDTVTNQLLIGSLHFRW